MTTARLGLSGVVETLLAQLVGEVPSREHRRTLEVCALVELTTEDVVRRVVGEHAAELFEWLRSLPFVESGPRGLYPHDVVRDALVADLRWRDPEGFEALHQLVDKVEVQARKAHEKQVDRRRRGGNDHHRWPVGVLEQGSVGGGVTPRVIENSQISIKPMTIEEAALELDVSEHGFVVFRDSTNDRLSVLYKRKDQHYGLIAPEF